MNSRTGKRFHRVKEVLQEQGKSQRWLHLKTGIPTPSIHGYVHNTIEPSLSSLHHIAKALKVKLKDLIK